MEAISVIKVLISQYGQIGVLILIFITGVYRCIQENGRAKVQQEQMKTQKALCDGSFKLHASEIKTAKEDSKASKKLSAEALKLANEANTCAKNIEKKVDNIDETFTDFRGKLESKYEEFLSGKYKNEKSNV